MNIAPREWLVVPRDDLRGVSCAFQVPPARAKGSALRARFPGDRLKAFSAWRPELEGLKASPCLNVRAMGDDVAVDLANAAHEGVLLSFGTDVLSRVAPSSKC